MVCAVCHERGLDRSQASLLPDCVEDEDNPFRPIDAFIDMLDLAALGFDVEPEAGGAIIRRRCSGSISAAISTRCSLHGGSSASARAISS